MTIYYRAIDEYGNLIECKSPICSIVRLTDGYWMQANGSFAAQPNGRYWFNLVDSGDGVTFTATLPDKLQTGTLYRIECSSQNAAWQTRVVDGSEVQMAAQPKPLKPNEVLVTVERETRTRDGAGGYTTTKTAIGGSPFVARLLRRQSRAFAEGAQERPGFVGVYDRVLVFENPAPALRAQDICTIDSVPYRIVALRPYRFTLQVDIEAAV